MPVDIRAGKGALACAEAAGEVSEGLELGAGIVVVLCMSISFYFTFCNIFHFETILYRALIYM
jgi:hypothetical protein